MSENRRMRRIAAVILLAACTTTQPTPPRQLPPPPAMSAEVQQQRERQLAEAKAAYEANPKDADALIWVGRRTAYLGRFRESIDVFREGVRKHPRDARMLRHRGHRYITVREFDRAIDDLTRAAELIKGTPDAIEPDGLPNARNIPTSTLQSNIWYHLGLAHYLRGDFDRALAAYREALAVSKNPDGVVSTSHWLYMTLRRMGRQEDAEKVLEAISPGMDVIENTAYHKLLLMYRGEIAPEELADQNPASTDGATILYGIGNWHLYNGEPERARPLFEKVISGGNWPAFGFIAAEADLARMDKAGNARAQ